MALKGDFIVGWAGYSLVLKNEETAHWNYYKVKELDMYLNKKTFDGTNFGVVYLPENIDLNKVLDKLVKAHRLDSNINFSALKDVKTVEIVKSDYVGWAQVWEYVDKVIVECVKKEPLKILERIPAADVVPREIYLFQINRNITESDRTALSHRIKQIKGIATICITDQITIEYYVGNHCFAYNCKEIVNSVRQIITEHFKET